MQSVPQLMPVGELLTVPAPVLATLSMKLLLILKVASIFWAVFIVTLQVPLLLVQAPDQPEKAYPVAGVALRITWVPLM